MVLQENVHFLERTLDVHTRAVIAISAGNAASTHRLQAWRADVHSTAGTRQSADGGVGSSEGLCVWMRDSAKSGAELAERHHAETLLEIAPILAAKRALHAIEEIASAHASGRSSAGRSATAGRRTPAVGYTASSPIAVLDGGISRMAKKLAKLGKARLSGDVARSPIDGSVSVKVAYGPESLDGR